MAGRGLDEISWNGQAFLAAVIEKGHVICRVPRETIQVLRIYSDIVGRGIRLERRNGVEKLAPFLIAKLAQVATGEAAEVLPRKVDD
jgi:hypothetical protein